MKAAAVGGGEASGGSPTAWRTPPAPPKRISPSGLPPSQKHCSPPGCRGRNRSSGGIAPSRISPRSSGAVGLAAQVQLCSRESVARQVSGESRQVRIAARKERKSVPTGPTVDGRRAPGPITTICGRSRVLWQDAMAGASDPQKSITRDPTPGDRPHDWDLGGGSQF